MLPDGKNFINLSEIRKLDVNLHYQITILMTYNVDKERNNS